MQNRLLLNAYAMVTAGLIESHDYNGNRAGEEDQQGDLNRCKSNLKYQTGFDPVV